MNIFSIIDLYGRREKIGFLSAPRLKNSFLLFIFILVGYGISSAGDVYSAPRESLILTTLNQIETMQNLVRQNALREAMEEAQIKMLEAKIRTKKERGAGFGNLASRTHFYITQETSLDDNVDKTEHNKKASLINKFTPGLKMSFIERKQSLFVDMHIYNKFYNNRSRENIQEAETLLSYNLNIGRYTLSLSDTYFNNFLAIEEIGVDDDDAENLWKNTFSANLGRGFNRVGFDMGYKRIDYDYESAYSDNDRVEETFNFNPYIRIAPKTRAQLEYSYERKKYTTKASPDDSHSNDFNLSLISILSPKLTGKTKLGYKTIDNKVSDDSRETAITGDLGYSFSERSNFALSLKRVIHEEPDKSDYYTENIFKLSGNHRLAFNPKLKLSFSTQADFKNYAKRTGLSSTWKDTYTLGFGLTYAFREWLDFSLDWTGTKVSSSVSESYNRNLVKFKTEAKF